MELNLPIRGEEGAAADLGLGEDQLAQDDQPIAGEERNRVAVNQEVEGQEPFSQGKGSLVRAVRTTSSHRGGMVLSNWRSGGIGW